jgi:sugar/nucleoside kinase (ribokinase family)
MYDIISIGAATVDIFAKSENFIVDDGLLSLKYSSKSEISQSLICSGGGASNSSVSFSRLGLKSACLSLIGNDNLNSCIIHDLRNNGVSTSLLVKSTKDSTDFSIILVAKDGGRSILTQRGQSRLEEKDIEWSKLKTKWFYITSLEGNIDLLEKIIGFAVENNIKISLNPGNRELQQKKLLLPLLTQVDFLLLNQSELEMLTGKGLDQPNLLTTIKKIGSQITAVTDGRKGAYIFYGDYHQHQAIIKTKTVDETGSGDAFGSTFVAGLINKLSPKEALNWGITNSSSVVSYLGAKSGLMTLGQIKHAA